MKIWKTDTYYPELLKRLDTPPSSFYFQGQIDILTQPYISIVGSREICPWVEQWMENELLPLFLELNWGVVSGGARGVDQLAHRMALRANVSTLIVLPSGLNYKYPSGVEQFSSYNNVGFISEYEPDEKIRKHFFYRRNQIIAGLSKYCLVIQAGLKSGTMITAKAALDIGSEVLALPGNAGDSKFSGNNQILYDGGCMIRNRFDLIPILSH